jgi:hypothetical protein
VVKGTDSRYTTGWDVVVPAAQVYYDRAEDLDFAIVVAKEKCAEWDYVEDPHGYCHERSVLQRLIRAAEAAR